jgi:hypothetical protein
MPARARQDLLEWSPAQKVAAWLGQVIGKEHDAGKVVHPDPRIRITDDLPYNEYFLLRGKQLY